MTREMAAFTRELLGEDRLQWLRELPRQQVCGSVALVHATPDTCWTSPTPAATDMELEDAYAKLEQKITVYGHIHLPFVRHVSKRTVANSGSVGMPFDGDHRASYLLITGPTAAIVEWNMTSRARFVNSLLRACLTRNGWPESSERRVPKCPEEKSLAAQS